MRQDNLHYAGVNDYRDGETDFDVVALYSEMVRYDMELRIISRVGAGRNWTADIIIHREDFCFYYGSYTYITIPDHRKQACKDIGIDIAEVTKPIHKGDINATMEDKIKEFQNDTEDN